MKMRQSVNQFETAFEQQKVLQRACRMPHRDRRDSDRRDVRGADFPDDLRVTRKSSSLIPGRAGCDGARESSVGHCLSAGFQFHFDFGIGLLVAALVDDFLAEDLNLAGGGDAETDFVARDAENHDFDVVADDDALLSLTRKYQHRRLHSKAFGGMGYY